MSQKLFYTSAIIGSTNNKLSKSTITWMETSSRPFIENRYDADGIVFPAQEYYQEIR